MGFWQRGDDHAKVRANTASLLMIQVERETFTDVSEGGSALILWAMQSEELKADSHIACRSPAMPCR